MINVFDSKYKREFGGLHFGWALLVVRFGCEMSDVGCEMSDVRCQM